MTAASGNALAVSVDRVPIDATAGTVSVEGVCLANEMRAVKKHDGPEPDLGPPSAFVVPPRHFGGSHECTADQSQHSEDKEDDHSRLRRWPLAHRCARVLTSAVVFVIHETDYFLSFVSCLQCSMGDPCERSS